LFAQEDNGLKPVGRSSCRAWVPPVLMSEQATEKIVKKIVD